MDVEVIKSVILVVGAPLALFQLALVYKKMYDQHDWNRRNNALRFSFSDDPHMIEILQRLDEHFNINKEIPRKIELSEINQKIEKDDTGVSEYPVVRNDIHFALARLETMCIAMKHNVADADICEDMLKTRVITFYKAFGPYIEEARGLRGSPKVFGNLQAYAEEWGANDIGSGKPATGKFPLLSKRGS